MHNIAGFYKEGQVHLESDQRFAHTGKVEELHTLQKEDYKIIQS